MKDQHGAAEIEFVLPCQDCGCHVVFHGPSRKWGTTELRYTAMLPVRRERRDLRDAALSIDGNRMSDLATAGYKMARQIIPIVPLLFTDVGIELRKLPEDAASTAKWK